jgi:hypothetical protein
MQAIHDLGEANASGLIHSGDSQLARSGSNSGHERFPKQICASGKCFSAKAAHHAATSIFSISSRPLSNPVPMPNYRRWPTGIPRAKAFCRIAPAVRFMAFEILATGVLLLECAFRSRTCSLVQATRFVRVLVLFGLVAINLIPVELAINNT